MRNVAQLPTICLPPIRESFALPELRRFDRVPEHHHDIVTLCGMVVIYETDSLGREELQPGAFYVVERQRPVAAMSWMSWLRLEMDTTERQVGPRSPLKTSREVVQLVRCPSGEDRWWHRMASGFHDGPYYDWSVGLYFVGKVVGVYAPGHGEGVQ